ncbi:MAG: tRNA 2-thiouridine(34) synthase MnmA [Verrucomicrobiota bacterium JB022]|nr:tRNA 2-thiouridine(34) synthase MnmA [Verrucomicrobiota bacterium JB022]
MGNRVLLGLSGGVDSAVAALRLKEQGYDVVGAYMKNWINEENVFGNCPWEQDIVDARAVCAHLGIPFEVINFMRDYRERIVNYLVEGYARGLTPNPDVMCNREMKFGVFLDWAREHGFDYVATGHYARRVDADGASRLLEGVDPNKDQSYFLALLQPEQLDAALFPVGELQKPEVRELARAANLPNADKKDSQGICFIGEVKINDFLEKFIPDQPGLIVNLQGKVLGEHRGLHRYTLGQRKGIGVPSNADNEFYVVVAKRIERNELVIAFESQKPDELWQQEIDLHQLSWVTPHPLTEAEDIEARVRYRDPRVAVRFEPRQDGSAGLIFAEPQRGLASGQVCALYRGEQLLGGGIYF